MALITFANAFIDRAPFWAQTMDQVAPDSIASSLPPLVAKAELRHFAIAMWVTMTLCLILSSFYRVFRHDLIPSNAVRFSAASKLLSPLLVALVPFFIPEHIRSDNVRKISVACGLLTSMLTKKIIVFSMAKITFSTIQSDAVPFLVLCAWLAFDNNITPLGARILLRGACLFHTYKLLRWARIAIHQICERLDINCFTIKIKQKKKND
jgi:hypothetical protein